MLFQKNLSRAFILIAFIVILLFSSCASTSKPASQATDVVTPTKIEVQSTPTIIYQSDWTKGLVDYGNPAGWQIVQNAAQSDGSKTSLVVPFQPGLDNFAFEVDIQVVKVTKDVSAGYVISSTPHDNQAAFEVSLIGMTSHPVTTPGYYPNLSFYLNPDAAMQRVQAGVNVDFDPKYVDHIFYFEVRGNHVSFYIDRGQATTVVCTNGYTLSHGPFTISVDAAIIRVSSIKVYSL
jgi:hypothetical protein